MKTKNLSIILFLLFSFSVGIGTINAATQVVKFRVENMTCGGCSGKIKKAILNSDGVADFSANLEARIVTITYDDQKVKSEDLKTAIQALKYNAVDYDPNEVISRSVSFKANQIGCGGCVAKVKNNIGVEAGVIAVDVDHPSKVVKIDYDANKTTAAELKADFQKFGYTVSRYYPRETIKYVSFKVENVGNQTDLESNLVKQKGVLDVTINPKSNAIAISYNASAIDEVALGESLKNNHLNLVVTN